MWPNKDTLRYFLGVQGTNDDQATAPMPHPVTVRLALMSPLLALVAAGISIASVLISVKSMKVGQRAYLTVTVAFEERNSGGSMTTKATNMGNTPATIRSFGFFGKEHKDGHFSVLPSEEEKLSWFTRDLAPKDSDWLQRARIQQVGEELETLMVFAGIIDYTDVFGGEDTVDYCYVQTYTGEPDDCLPDIHERAIRYLEKRIEKFRYKKNLKDHLNL